MHVDLDVSVKPNPKHRKRRLSGANAPLSPEVRGYSTQERQGFCKVRVSVRETNRVGLNWQTQTEFCSLPHDRHYTHHGIRTAGNRILLGSGSNIQQPRNFDLTLTEYKVLTLLVEGCSRPEIANKLTISINTVKMHFRSLYLKLGVSNAKDAIHIAIKNNLLS